MSGPLRYDAIAMLLHWVTALAVLGLIAMGLVMTDLKPGSHLQFSLYQWHKSVGITVLALSILRLGWRLAHRPPELPAAMPPWEKTVSHLTHWGFYVLLLAMPMTGWATVSASPLNIPTVLYGVLPWPHLPWLPGLENKKAVEEVLEDIHGAGGNVMIGLIVLHVAAALRHRILLKDQVVQRMLPRFLPALLVAAAVAGVGGTAHAADWAVDFGASRLGFAGVQSGSPFEGRFTRWQADIAFDPADPAGGHARIAIDMTSAVTGDKQKDESLPQSDWFDAKAFPQALFEASGFRAKGGNAYEAEGSLSIRGVRKTVVLPFTLDISGDTAHARGKLDLLRTDYGVGQGAWSDGSIVALAVAVTVDVTAKRRP
jgi:cytochrome b561/polyisoprenoid-binding protein YceI